MAKTASAIWTSDARCILKEVLYTTNVVRLEAVGADTSKKHRQEIKAQTTKTASGRAQQKGRGGGGVTGLLGRPWLRRAQNAISWDFLNLKRAQNSSQIAYEDSHKICKRA